MPQESGFDTFLTDYDKVNWIDTKTYTKRKVYDDKPYLILPNFRFNVKLGDTLPIFKCYVKKCGEQFGDPISLPAIDTYDFVIRVYDYNNQIIFVGDMEVTNADLGELSYTFKNLDFSQAGIYYCEIEAKSSLGTFTLPDTHIKYEIIVRD